MLPRPPRELKHRRGWTLTGDQPGDWTFDHRPETAYTSGRGRRRLVQRVGAGAGSRCPAYAAVDPARRAVPHRVGGGRWSDGRHRVVAVLGVGVRVVAGAGGRGPGCPRSGLGRAGRGDGSYRWTWPRSSPSSRACSLRGACGCRSRTSTRWCETTRRRRPGRPSASSPARRSARAACRPRPTWACWPTPDRGRRCVWPAMIDGAFAGVPPAAAARFRRTGPDLHDDAAQLDPGRPGQLLSAHRRQLGRPRAEANSVRPRRSLPVPVPLRGRSLSRQTSVSSNPGTHRHRPTLTGGDQSVG